MIRNVTRIILAIVSTIFLAWFIAPSFWGIWHIGCIIGILMCLGVLFRTAFHNIYLRLKIALLRNKITTILFRIAQLAGALVIVYCVAVSSFMVYAMVPWNNNEPKTAIVLGAQVSSSGPTVILWQRIDAAEKFLNEHPDAVAIVTGGQGDNEPISEAQSMYENMVKDGIDPERIIREDQAKNTDENIRFSLKIIEDKKLSKDAAIVSDSYHQLRAALITRKNDKDVRITPVNTANNTLVAIAAYPSYFVREWLAIPVEIFK